MPPTVPASRSDTPPQAAPAAGRGNAVIQFHPDAFLTGRQNLMGRHAAGEGFLRGFLRHAEIDVLAAWGEAGAMEGLAAFAASVPGGRNAGLPRAWAPSLDHPVLRQVGAVWLPEPGIARVARQRNAAGLTGAYSVTGITHTISSHNAMDALADLASGPVRPWDALICTSRCVRDAVDVLMAQRREALAAQGLTAGPAPQLPVIPLGVDAAALDPRSAGGPAWRSRWREQLGIGRHDLVVLFVGRLSFHAKAHPLPMLVALEQAQAALDRPVHLIQSGWFANAAIEAAFRTAAEELAPSVHHHYVDGRTPDARSGIWYAADVFCSLSDNIQETFGLTPIEAMAAGLPVVVTDWDGYRDTVPDGVAGIRVPTLTPAAGAGAELAEAYADGRLTYDMYCGAACLATAVDIAATRAAFESLLGDAARRAAMAEAGRRHAAVSYDWSVIVRAYQELWADLAALRPQGAAAEALPVPDDHGGRVPAWRPDPFALFDTYPTHRIGPATVLAPAAVPTGRAGMVSALGMNNFAPAFTGSSPDSQRVLEALRRLRTASVEQLASDSGVALPRTLREAGWLVKLGLAEVA